jgi:DNA-binding transcriptional LysR family regulator
MPVDFSVIILSPLLAEFSKRYPGIRFELDISPKIADLIGDSIDVAIRMGQPKDKNLIARRIAEFETLLVASPEYLRSRGAPKTPQDLLRHDCLRTHDQTWVLNHRDGRSESVAVSGSFVANNKGLLHQLATRGQGIIQSSLAFVEEDLRDKRLVRVLPDWKPPCVQAFALTTTRLLPAKVRLFLDFLEENLNSKACS